MTDPLSGCDKQLFGGVADHLSGCDRQLRGGMPDNLFGFANEQPHSPPRCMGLFRKTFNPKTPQADYSHVLSDREEKHQSGLFALEKLCTLLDNPYEKRLWRKQKSLSAFEATPDQEETRVPP